MFVKSWRFYQLVLWIMVSTSTTVLFYCVSTLFLSSEKSPLLWIHIVIYAAGYFICLLYGIRKFPKFLRFLLSIIIMGGFLFGAKYAAAYFVRFPMPDDKTLGIIAGSIWLVFYYILSRMHKRSERIYGLLDEEKSHDSIKSFSLFVKQQVGDDAKKLEPDWFIRQVSNISFILLIVCFVTVVKEPAIKSLLSIYMVVFALSGLGIYFILYQFSNFIKWTMMGILIKKEMVFNWNKLIRLFYIPVIIIPLLIPWSFKIFNINKITEILNKWLEKYSIKIISGAVATQDEAYTATGTASAAASEQAKQVMGFLGTAIRYIIYAIVIYLGISLILGIFGGLIFEKYRYQKKNIIIRLLINRYLKIKVILDIIYELFSPIFNLFAPKKNKDGESKKKLEQHFYSFFEDYKEMTSEKMDEIRLIIKDFIRYIDTASRVITPYHFSYGPSEYTDRVIEKRPDIELILRDIVSVFNESRYSLHLLEMPRKESFHKMIDQAIHEIERP